MAQLVARFHGMEEVGGSNPPSSTIPSATAGGVADDGAMAQLVARFHGMEEVGGSNPPSSTPTHKARTLTIIDGFGSSLVRRGGPSGRLVETCPGRVSDGASASVDPRSTAQGPPLKTIHAADATSIRRPPPASGSCLRCRRGLSKQLYSLALDTSGLVLG